MKIFLHTYLLLSFFAVMVVVQLAQLSSTNDTSTSISAWDNIHAFPATSHEELSPVANYRESDNSWSFSARVIEIKDVSIYGRPGSIAKIEYLYSGGAREAWAVLKIEGYSFAENTSDITVADQITLRVFGDYVSSKGVDWNSCPESDEFCQYASFIEGGFPSSEDYGGLTISPSNKLIYSGNVEDDWINGMLAWRISLENCHPIEGCA
jgi:hypothetical protein